MAKKTRRTAPKKSGRTGASLRNDSIPRSLLARELQKRITQLGLSRNDAAIAVGDAASQMSRLMTGHITDFSADRLVKMLLRLGSEGTITVRHGSNAGKRGKVRVSIGAPSLTVVSNSEMNYLLLLDRLYILPTPSWS